MLARTAFIEYYVMYDMALFRESKIRSVSVGFWTDNATARAHDHWNAQSELVYHWWNTMTFHEKLNLEVILEWLLDAGTR